MRRGTVTADERGTRLIGVCENDGEDDRARRGVTVLGVRVPDSRRTGAAALPRERPVTTEGPRDRLVLGGRLAVEGRVTLLGRLALRVLRDPAVSRLIAPREVLRPEPLRVLETRGEDLVLDDRLTWPGDEDRDLPGRERVALLREPPREGALRALERPRVDREPDRRAVERLEVPRDFDRPAVLRALVRFGGPAQDSLAVAIIRPAANTTDSSVRALTRALIAYPPANNQVPQKFFLDKTDLTSIVLIC